MLREILKPSKNKLTIDIPDAYVNRRIEVLVLPFFEMDSAVGEANYCVDEDLHELFAEAPGIKIDKNIDIDALMNEVNDVVL